jgi:hypothetical protein
MTEYRPSAAGSAARSYTAAMHRLTSTPAGALVAAAGLAAVLALAQVALAELTGITTLTDSFMAGGERYVEQQVTLVAWFCAVSTVISATALARRFTERRLLRRAIPAVAGLGTLAVVPLINARAFDYIGRDATRAAVLGAIVGAAAGLIGSGRRRVGLGVALHAALVWVAGGLTSGLVWDSTLVYAGMVQLYEFALLDEQLGDVASGMLPFAAAVVLGAGVFAGWLARRGATRRDEPPTRREAVLAAAAGPVLAVLMYPIGGLWMYNAEAAPVLALTALAALGTAMLGATVLRGRRQ